MTNADEVVALMRIERFRPPETGGAAAVAATLSTLSTDYVALLAPHAKIHGELFNRVRLDLGGGADRVLTTDELLALAPWRTRRIMSPCIDGEAFYDACRYVVLCSSGDLLPNLQGHMERKFGIPRGTAITARTPICNWPLTRPAMPICPN